MKMEVITTATTCRMMMREMIDWNLITLLLLRDEISDPSNGVNLDLGAAFRKLFAQTVNVDLDRIRCDFSRVSEDVIFDLFLGNHTPFAAHQKLQHRGFAGRQQLRLVVDRGLPVSGIEFEIGDAQRAPEQVAGPPQLGFQPRNQFLQCERLHQIIVRAAAQAVNAVMQAAARGEDQNRNGVVSVPNLAQQSKAVTVRQSEVQDEGGVERRQKDACCFFDGGQDVCLIAGRSQALCQEFGQLLIVFHDQQPHPQRPHRSAEKLKLAMNPARLSNKADLPRAENIDRFGGRYVPGRALLWI